MENPKLGRRFLHYEVLDNFVDLKKSLLSQMAYRSKTANNLVKLDILAKIYCQKLIFCRIFLLKNRVCYQKSICFCRKSKFLTNDRNFRPKIEIFVKQSKFLSNNRNFCPKIDFLVKQSKSFSKNWNFLSNNRNFWLKTQVS